MLALPKRMVYLGVITINPFIRIRKVAGHVVPPTCPAFLFQLRLVFHLLLGFGNLPAGKRQTKLSIASVIYGHTTLSEV